jgi:hypothetical protein
LDVKCEKGIFVFVQYFMLPTFPFLPPTLEPDLELLTHWSYYYHLLLACLWKRERYSMPRLSSWRVSQWSGNVSDSTLHAFSWNILMPTCPHGISRKFLLQIFCLL